EMHDLSDGTLAAVRFEDRRTRPAGLRAASLRRFRRSLTAAEDICHQDRVGGLRTGLHLAPERARGHPGAASRAGVTVHFSFDGPMARACLAAVATALVVAAFAVVCPAAAPLAGAAAPVAALAAATVPGPAGQWVHVETATAAARGDPIAIDGSELLRGGIGLRQCVQFHESVNRLARRSGCGSQLREHMDAMEYETRDAGSGPSAPADADPKAKAKGGDKAWSGGLLKFGFVDEAEVFADAAREG
ncbi:unnamed protein product, partial [Prorocentrum cordatum]